MRRKLGGEDRAALAALVRLRTSKRRMREGGRGVMIVAASLEETCVALYHDAYGFMC